MEECVVGLTKKNVPPCHRDGNKAPKQEEGDLDGDKVKMKNDGLHWFGRG
jgi:hypothetical protein